MAKDHARVNVTIWTDPDFRALPPAAQHLYLTLWTSPDLSYCGVHDWRPAKLTGLSRGLTSEHIRTIADCLSARHFVVIDDATEEILVRSWARFDGLMKQPRMAISYVTAYAATGSQSLRLVIAHETKRMHAASPHWACWSDKRVAEILEHPEISAKSLPTPSDPFGGEVGDGFALGLPQTQPNVWGSVSGRATPAPAPAPHSSTPKGGSRAAALPADWSPNEGHRAFGASNDLNIDEQVEQFRDHHIAKGSTMKDWDASFRTWLRNAVKWRKDSQAKPAPRIPHVSELEQPPDGLTVDEYAQWDYERRQKRVGA